MRQLTRRRYSQLIPQLETPVVQRARLILPRVMPGRQLLEFAVQQRVLPEVLRLPVRV